MPTNKSTQNMVMYKFMSYKPLWTHEGFCMKFVQNLAGTLYTSIEVLY